MTYGADSVIHANHEELKYPRNDIDTKVMLRIAKDATIIKEISPEYSHVCKTQIHVLPQTISVDTYPQRY